MKQTYEEAITRVFQDEGGYSNDVGDPGGPTNWGITIEDARMYWKPDATASDIRSMPKSVAETIYENHYAKPINYDSLPAGIDYAVLDYGINSGISRAAKVLQTILKVEVDGLIGPATIAAASKANAEDVINAIYSERISFLRSLSTWSRFGRGWLDRCTNGRILALNLCQKYRKITVAPPVVTVPAHTATTVAIGAGGAATVAVSKGIALSHVLIGLGIIALVLFIGIELYKYWRSKNVNVA